MAFCCYKNVMFSIQNKAYWKLFTQAHKAMESDEIPKMVKKKKKKGIRNVL